jgi:uncharacterized protein (DUF3084 family)
MSALNDYYAALERLKANKPIVLPKGSAINNDTVAMEAGRKRGSIKKSRHAALIEAIEQAAQAAGQNVLSPAQRIEQAKSKTKAVKSDYEQLKEDYEKLLEKCNSLLLENFELKKNASNLMRFLM